MITWLPRGLSWEHTLWGLPRHLHLPLALHPHVATLAELHIRLSARLLPWRSSDFRGDQILLCPVLDR